MNILQKIEVSFEIFEIMQLKDKYFFLRNTDTNFNKFLGIFNYYSQTLF